MGKLNPTQIGTAGQLRFAMLAMLGSGGDIELVPPLADDEGRDFELHLRHRFGRPLSVQIKVSSALGDSACSTSSFPAGNVDRSALRTGTSWRTSIWRPWTSRTRCS